LGLGNLFWVPFSVKFGKRPALLISMALLFAVLIWTAKATNYRSLLAARCIAGFAASAGEVSLYATLWIGDTDRRDPEHCTRHRFGPLLPS